MTIERCDKVWYMWSEKIATHQVVEKDSSYYYNSCFLAVDQVAARAIMIPLEIAIGRTPAVKSRLDQQKALLMSDL